MKVLGYTDEITTCDCCGKRNLKGSFAIETDAGKHVFYGSVCVNKVYGTKRAKDIKFTAQKISKVQADSWDRTIDLLSRGHLHPFIGFIGEKAAWNNSREQMNAVTSIRDYRTGQVIREREA